MLKNNKQFDIFWTCLQNEHGTFGKRKSEIKTKKSEIIIPCQSYISTASTIIRCGAKPIIIEIDKNYNLDFEDLKRKINKNTKAVVIVHFGGCISEKIFEIKKFLKSKKIILVEDAAHSLGASYNNIKAGNLGDISAFFLIASDFLLLFQLPTCLESENFS